MKLEKVLKNLGFSKNEAKVYLAALTTGLASAQDIAKQAGLQRTTTYSVLNVLVQKGVVGKSKVRGKSRFLAESPQKLVALAQEVQSDLDRALPELEAIHNRQEKKPKVLFYEGKEAIQNVYDDTLREQPKEILEWNTDAYFTDFPKDHDYIDTRVKLGIHAKRIAGKGSKWDTEHKRYDPNELSETAIVPKDMFWPDIEVNIYNNKVAFMNYEEKNSVIIESQVIADAMRQVYELSWLGARGIEEK